MSNISSDKKNLINSSIQTIDLGEGIITKNTKMKSISSHSLDSDQSLIMDISVG